MVDITNSHSLTDFQRNARDFIRELNESRKPTLITVNGKVEAVLVDPATYQNLEQTWERERFLAALKEGEQAIQEGRVRDANEVYEDLKAKHGL